MNSIDDGQPDLQGVWDFRTITPMERPASLGNKEFFANDEEVAGLGARGKNTGWIRIRSIRKPAA